MKENEKIQRFYDQCASHFDEEQEEFAFVRTPEKQIILETFKNTLKPTQTVLEIGAGTGRFTLNAAPLVKHITAVDVSPSMLNQLNLKKEQNHLANITTRQGCFMELDFKEPFDVIMSFSAIEYIPHKKALFEKIGHLLKPNGHLIITTANNTFFRFWGRVGNFFIQKVYMQAYSKREIRRLLTKNNMHAITIQDMCMKYFPFQGIMLYIHAQK